MTKTIQTISVFLVVLTVFSVSIYAQDTTNNISNNNIPDMTNWSDEKIKLWEDSVKKVLFPQPVVASTTDTSITSAVRSKSSRAMAASTSNSYVPNYHSIDQTKAVGEIAISQSISPSGATTYAVPIDIYQSPN